MSKVTGVVTSFNQEDFIIESVSSLSEQVDELIVIDDNSTDRSWELIQSYAAGKKHLFTYQNSANQGISESFNRGFQMSTGDLILIQGGDDSSLPDRRHIQENILESNQEIILAFCQPNVIDHDGNKMNDSYASDSFINVLGKSNYTRKLLLEGNSVCAPSVAFRRTEFTNGKLFHPNVDHAQDFATWLTLSMKGDFYFTENPYLNYRIHGKNISRFIDDSEDVLNRARSKEIAYLINTFINELSKTETLELARKLQVSLNNEFSLLLNKIQIKRLISNSQLLSYCIDDCYQISQMAIGEEYTIAREMLKSFLFFPPRN